MTIANRRTLEAVRAALRSGAPPPTGLDIYFDSLEELAELTVVERWADGVDDRTLRNG